MIKKIFIFVLLICISKFTMNNKSGQTSRFDKSYRDCRSSQCQFRSNDDNCNYRCMEQECYDKIYGNYLLEFGEINIDMKKEFENCFNLK